MEEAAEEVADEAPKTTSSIQRSQRSPIGDKGQISQLTESSRDQRKGHTRNRIKKSYKENIDVFTGEESSSDNDGGCDPEYSPGPTRRLKTVKERKATEPVRKRGKLDVSDKKEANGYIRVQQSNSSLHPCESMEGKRMIQLGKHTNKETTDRIAKDYTLRNTDRNQQLRKRNSPMKQSKKSLSKESDIGIYTCELCPSTFSRPYQLNAHLKLDVDKPFTCKTCNAVFDHKGSYVVHRKQHRTPQCTVCKATFSTVASLNIHMKEHLGTRPYSCDVCGAVFARIDDRDTHMKLHTGEDPYKCTLCELTFKTRNERSKHLSTHAGAKPHSCHFCSATFSRKSDRDIHLRVHTGERPYSCEICFATFSQSAAVRTHQASHTTEKPFECKQCGATFSKNEYLKIHAKRHEKMRFPCTLCKAGFIARGELRNHMRTHTGERPYACSVCSFAFARHGDLIMHLRKHTGEKPYLCKACNKAFARSCTLLQHQRKNCKFRQRPDMNS